MIVYKPHCFILHSLFQACRSKIEPQQDFTQDENVTRGNWTNKFDFFIVGIGYIISTGNLSTFPAKCQQYGGGRYFIKIVFILSE